MSNFWIVGKSYFIRTITMYHLGKLKEINDKELIFEKASWIADSGRFHDFLSKGILNEVEPFVGDILINRDCIIDACYWMHDLPLIQK